MKDNSLATRFFSKIEKTPSGCWNWIAGKNKEGYGWFSYPTGADKSIGAHVASYRYFYGEVPKGKQVNHHCDNTSCVNPIHIYAGTPKENTNDMVRRGRWNAGAKKKEFCKRGHKIADNYYTRLDTGVRQCRPCSNLRKNGSQGGAA